MPANGPGRSARCAPAARGWSIAGSEDRPPGSRAFGVEGPSARSTAFRGPASRGTASQGDAARGARARLAVLLSGRGSNFLALHAAVAAGELPAEIVLVVSNVAAAPGLEHARRLDLATAVVPHRGRSREAHEEAVLEALAAAGAEWICLAGYMRLLSPAFVARYPARIVNVHPSLLPAFPGLDAQRQAFEHGVKVAGCTVHLVDDGLDSGPIVEQRAVAVADDDSPESLAARILAAEHQAYPAALARLLGEPWRVVGRRVVFGREKNCRGLE